LLKQILSAYSEADLYKFIRRDYFDQYKKIKGRELTKAELVVAVEALAIDEILLNENNRIQFIERMTPKVVNELLVKLLIKSGESQEVVVDKSTAEQYAILKIIANQHLLELLKILDCEEILDVDTISSEAVHGVSRIPAQYPLYPYQDAIVRKVNELIITSEECRCLIHLPTGAGKTRTAMNIVCEHIRKNPKALVLWLADTAELCAQAAIEFSKAWMSLGSRDAKLYSYYSDSNISLGGIDRGFIVASLQKLHATRNSDLKILYDHLRSHVTLVVFDEAHKAIAPTYKQTVIDMLGDDNKAFLLGLSATPGRNLEKDNEENRKLAVFFGEKKVTMKVAGFASPIKYLVEEGYLAKANFNMINYHGQKVVRVDQFENQSISAQIREALSEDEQRNIALINVIKDEHSKGSSIIVFSCSVEHSRALASMLAFEGIKAYSLDSNADNSESRRYKVAKYSSGKVKVLINYNILTAGFDAPITNVAIIARPTDSLVQYSQMAGRAMRGTKSGGHKECRIYTVRDDIPAFTSVLNAFSHWDQMWSEC
jgi:DNA repair protein RadD